ncbi:MAG: M20 metallopeptidase family protein [Bilifractor sp.]|jgi:amidohydrolase
MNILGEAFQSEADLIELRRYFHRHPETGWHESGTRDKIGEVLTEEGIPFFVACGTGIIADIAGKNSGERILGIRADIDALPVREKTGLPYSSENDGVMHACGHDAHIAILLETAKILNAHRDELKSRVRLIFQPAEEIISDCGAARMREIREVRECDRLIGLHVSTLLPAGQASIQAGPVMASADMFDVRITGKGGHAAHPDRCTDPVAAAVMFYEGVSRIIAHDLDPISPAVISITSIRAGHASNVIPDSASLSGTTRAADPELRNRFEEILKKIGDSVEKGTGTRVRVTYHRGMPAVINDSAAAELGKKAAEEVFGRENVLPLPFSMGGDDFSHYPNEKAFLFLGCAFRDPEKNAGLHSPGFDLDEKAMKLGVAWFLQYVRDWEEENLFIR